MLFSFYEYFSNKNAFSWFAYNKGCKHYEKNWQLLFTREFSLEGKETVW